MAILMLLLTLNPYAKIRWHLS